MKTIRTILATFGVTSALYGLFALIMMRMNPAFTGRTIYQLFRETGFVALVIGIGIGRGSKSFPLCLCRCRACCNREQRCCKEDS